MLLSPHRRNEESLATHDNEYVWDEAVYLPSMLFTKPDGIRFKSKKLQLDLLAALDFGGKSVGCVVLDLAELITMQKLEAIGTKVEVIGKVDTSRNVQIDWSWNIELDVQILRHLPDMPDGIT